jgi:predicted amidohydrolase
VKVALAQCSPFLGDLKKNLDLVLDWTGRARKAGARLVLFPELSLSGYFVKDLVADLALRPGSAPLQALARASRSIDLAVGGILEEPSGRFFNAAFFFRKGRLAGVHRKVYLPTYGMFDEGRYFGAGTGVSVLESSAGPTACLVCEDAWHAVLPLAGALQGARLLCLPSSSPARGVSVPETQGSSSEPKMTTSLAIAETWSHLNKTWASTLGTFVAYCNRVGFEDGVGFWGGSELVDPYGRTVAKAALFKEELLLAEMEEGLVRRARTASPLLRDEKLDMDARLFAGLAGWTPREKEGRA